MIMKSEYKVYTSVFFPSNIQYEWQLLKIKTQKMKAVVCRAYYKIVLR